MKYSKSLETIQSTKGSDNFSGSNAQRIRTAVPVLLKSINTPIIQRNKYWKSDTLELQKTTNIGDLGGGTFYERIGDATNQIYANADSAKTAARATVAWDNANPTLDRTDSISDAPAKGVYSYNAPLGTEESYGAAVILSEDTNVVVNHNEDTNCELNKVTKTKQSDSKPKIDPIATPINHFHAGQVKKDSDIGNNYFKRRQPGYTQLGDIEHYLVKPA